MLLITNNLRNGDRTEFFCDERDHKTSIQYFDSQALQRFQDGNVVVGGSLWDAATSGIGVPMGGTITTTYNQFDQPTEAQIRNAFTLLGKLISSLISITHWLPFLSIPYD